MKVYIFGTNFRGFPDWYYTEHEINKPRRVEGDGRSVLVFAAPPVNEGGIAYIFGVRALAAAIRQHNLFFRQPAAEAEAARRWQERFGG